MGIKIDEIKTKQQQSPFSEKKKHKTSFLQKEITLFGSSFSNKIKEDFYTELSVLLKAGVSLKESLVLLQNAQNKQTTKEIIEKVVHQIVEGSTFSEAIAKQTAFTEYEYFSLSIGEETGTLAIVAEQLGYFYARKNEHRRTVINALTYPIIILLTALLVVIFMLRFVVPMFQDIFEQQQVELPFITQVIVDLSNSIQNYGGLFLLGLLLIIIGIRLIKNKPWFQKNRDLLLVRLPFVGQFYKTVYLSQFTQAVSLLMSAKVPMVRSIELVKKMINFYPLQQSLVQVEHDLLQGKSLSESMKRHQVFNDKMVALVKVAEETNQNEFIFERMNDQYATQLQQQSKMLSTVMEPFIILFVGVLVGVILVAMYLPMFKLSSALG